MASRRGFGVLALTMLAGCATAGSVASGERVWTGTIPAGDAPRSVVTLIAHSDGRATLTQAVDGEAAPKVQQGAWIEDGALLQVRLAEPGSPRTTDRLIWHVDGDRLTPREWDRLIWGLDGVTMMRQP